MTKKTENIEQLREDAFTPEIFDFQIKIPLKDIPYSLEKRFVYRMFMEFHCENDEAEPIVLSSTPLVLGDRKNKLKGLISVVNKDSERSGMRYIKRRKSRLSVSV
ncbi:hypothetical protein ACTWKC_07325 [Bacillus sp. 4A_MP3]